MENASKKEDESKKKDETKEEDLTKEGDETKEEDEGKDLVYLDEVDPEPLKMDICLPGSVSSERLPDVLDFYRIIQTSFKEFLDSAVKIDKDIRQMAIITQNAFRVKLQLLNSVLPFHEKPATLDEVGDLIEPLTHAVNNVKSCYTGYRYYGFMRSNYLAMISESINALCWIVIEPSPVQFIRDMIDSGQYYANRVLGESKSEQTRNYVKSWVQVLNDLETHVKTFHRTGYSSWGKKIKKINTVPLPPPLPEVIVAVPPEIPVIDESSDVTKERAALLRDLNQGLEITKRLKKVEDSKEITTSEKKLEKLGSRYREKKPKFTLEGKKWCIEHQSNKEKLLIDQAELSQSVSVYDCDNSCIIVENKVNVVTIDNCKKTSLILHDIIAQIEVIHSGKIQIQCDGKVPLISVDSSDDVEIFVKEVSMDVEIFSSKSSSLNVVIIKPDGNLNELPVPEQIKTVIQNGVLKSAAVEKM